MNDENDKPKKDNDWGMTIPNLRSDKEKGEDDFSDDFAAPPKSAKQSPMDDWEMIPPNLDEPNSQTVSSDFDKTTSDTNIPKDVGQDETPLMPIPLPTEDWGRTIHNISISREGKSDDWEVTIPTINNPKQEKEDEWSMPEPIFRVSEGENLEEVAKRTAVFNLKDIQGMGKITPDSNFSEVSPPEPLNQPAPSQPTPSQTAPKLNLQPQPDISEAPPFKEIAIEDKVENKPPARPSNYKTVFIAGGLFSMLLFTGVVSSGIYLLYFNNPSTAEKIEPVREEPSETTAPSVLPVRSDAVLPKEIEYKGMMVLVSDGESAMGKDANGEESKSAQKIILPAFYIDKTEVTNSDYKAFCDASGKSLPPNSETNNTPPPNAPVVGVSFVDAKAYAESVGKRLPTEAEWEKAAFHDGAAQTKRAFPWGDDSRKDNVAVGFRCALSANDPRLPAVLQTQSK